VRGEVLRIRGEWIELGQLLKRVRAVDSGGAAKRVVQDGRVRVNGRVETRRGAKLRPGDVVEFEGRRWVVEACGSSLSSC
jgi:ribosome-associated protein